MPICTPVTEWLHVRLRLRGNGALQTEDRALLDRVRALELFHGETTREAEEQLLLQDTAVEPAANADAARGTVGQAWLDRFIASFADPMRPIARPEAGGC